MSRTRLRHATQETNATLATGGLYAPTIRHYNGTFYIVCTNSRRGALPSNGRDDDTSQDEKDNFIVTTTDIWGNTWSDPIPFAFTGIDPDIFFEGNKTYITGAGMSSTLVLFEVNPSTGEKLSEEKAIWAGSGGKDVEAPHIYKRDGYYYLLAAEGGTHEGHMATMARSKNIWGPYESSPRNPIVSAANTTEYIQHVGHCDIFQDHEAAWWGVCLGVRKNQGGRWNLGRETFLTPGLWDQGWFSLQTVKSAFSRPITYTAPQQLTSVGGVDWVYIRNADLDRYRLSGKGAALLASTTDLDHHEQSPTFVGKRQPKLVGRSEVTLRCGSALRAGKRIITGVAVYKDEHRFVRIYYKAREQRVVFELVNHAKNLTKLVEHELEDPKNVRFQIRYTEREYLAFYGVGRDGARGSDRELTLLGGVDTLDLVDKDFVGPVVGIFAVAEAEGQYVQFSGLSLE
jgi:beta-xylosidase